MRHINRTVDSQWSGKHVVTEPYMHDYVNAYYNSGFKKASQKKVYVKFLRYVADHDGCTRKEILKGLGRGTGRGQNSSLFAQLLYLDLIDYDKNFKYHITDKGEEVLNTAYMNDMEKYVKDDKKQEKMDDDREEVSESRKPTMKKLNITKEAFEKSRYFQKKYGTLEYVSESGKVFKTSKGKLLKFNESTEEFDDIDTKLEEIFLMVDDGAPKSMIDEKKSEVINIMKSEHLWNDDVALNFKEWEDVLDELYRNPRDPECVHKSKMILIDMWVNAGYDRDFVEQSYSSYFDDQL